MIIVDLTIKDLIEKGLISLPDPSLINPASLDFKLGDVVLVEQHPAILWLKRIHFWLLKAHGISGKAPERWQQVDIAERTESNPYWLFPGAFILGIADQALHTPATLVGLIVLKSSRAREGYNHPPTLIDPGYCGAPTLEISNTSRWYRLPLYPGLRFGQYVFIKTTEAPSVLYGEVGRYQNAVTVEPSKG
jgi:dCTP deaminase